MGVSHLGGVKRTLPLVKHDHMVIRHAAASAAIGPDVVLDTADKRASTTTCALQLVLQTCTSGPLPERNMAEDGASRLASRSGSSEWTIRRPTSVLPAPGTPVTRTSLRVRVAAASRTMSWMPSTATSVWARERHNLGTRRL